MDNAHFIARIIGVTFIAFFGSMLVHPSFYQGLLRDAFKRFTCIIVSGLFVLIAGLLIVNSHPEWKANWEGVVTLLGWLFIIGGIVRLLIPETVRRISQKNIEKKHLMTIVATIMVLIGLYLAYAGFFL